MKKILLFSIVVLLCFALNARAQNVDIFGYYTIQKPSKEFSDISEIHLAGAYGERENPPFYGLIRLKKKSAKDFRLLKPALNGNNIAFSTKAVGGVSYKFSGAFLKLGNFPEMQPNGEILLVGKLSKYRGKSKIAEAEVKLLYNAGD